MLSESLRAPFRADDWIGTILVGSVLTLLVGLVVGGWLVVLLVSPPVGGLLVALVALPSLVLRGYLIGVVRSGLCDQSAVDSFVNWGRLVRDGTQSAFISVCYLLPAALLCGLALGGAIATVVDPDGFEGPLQGLAAVVILVGGFGMLSYGLVYLYIRPAARAVFASTGSVRAALDVRRVVRLSVTADYITGWLVAMGILVVGPLFVSPLFFVSLAVAAVSPPLALVGVLSTFLLSIGVLFVCRVSAAWATGRGSATHLIAVGLLADPADTDGSPQSASTATERSEASAAVQTGRTVPLNGASTADETNCTELPALRSAMLPVRLHDDDLSGIPVYPRAPTAGQHSTDSERTENDTEHQRETGIDHPTERSAGTQTDDTADETTAEAEIVDNESGFIWGPDDE